jgi:acetyl-CoA carboxylase carboxyl transferase subunit beta
VAEPGALIGFTGPRVVRQTVGQKIPPGFQQAEFMLEHGLIDLVEDRRRLRPLLAQLLKFHQGGRHG